MIDYSFFKNKQKVPVAKNTYVYGRIQSHTFHRMGKELHETCIFKLNVYTCIYMFPTFCVYTCFLRYVDTTIPPNIIGHHSDLQPVPEPVTEFRVQNYPDL